MMINEVFYCDIECDVIIDYFSIDKRGRGLRWMFLTEDQMDLIIIGK